MNKGAIVTSRFYNNNRLFDIKDKVSNRDNCLFHMYLLKIKLQNIGIQLSTFDVYPEDEYDFFIFFDFDDSYIRKIKELYNNKKTLYLIILESELIIPNNWVKKNHKFFKKIFTWNDNWVDGELYIKIFWPNKIPKNIEFDVSKKTKFCTLIASNKRVYNDERELYSERIKAIRWFERNHPTEFDLFGIGWDKGEFNTNFNNIFKSNLLAKCIRKVDNIQLLQKVLSPFKEYFPSYKGKIISKKDVYSKYKFAICYENAKDITGYITEKIFDCFFAGCVPVYLGKQNINDSIPSNTFIDKRNFKTYDDLYFYLTNMSEQKYMDYLNAIREFINSGKIYPFSADNFVNVIIENIIYLY